MKSIQSLSRLPNRSSTPGSPILWARNTSFCTTRVKGDVAAAIEQLPYQFKDPHKLDKKTDPRKLTFGSRIEKESEAEREEFFTVKEILCPEKVRLSNGLTAKPIGIKSEPFTHDKAVG